MSTRLGLALVIATLSACVTPSIPIPPPDGDNMAFALDTGTGTATFSYTASQYGGATVYVFDRNVGRGVIDTARDDGSVGPTPPFTAAAGDLVDVSFQLGDQVTSLCVILREGAPSTTCP